MKKNDMISFLFYFIFQLNNQEMNFKGTQKALYEYLYSILIILYKNKTNKTKRYIKNSQEKKLENLFVSKTAQTSVATTQ